MREIKFRGKCKGFNKNWKAMHAEKPVDDWLNTLAYLPKYGPNRWYPEHAKVIAMENRYEPRGGAAG